MDQEIRRKMGGREIVKKERANVLLPGDRINFAADQPGAPYGWGTVVRVDLEKDVAVVIRPHVCTGLKLYTNLDGHGTHVTHETHHEEIDLPRHSDRVYHVVFRSQTPEE